MSDIAQNHQNRTCIIIITTQTYATNEYIMLWDRTARSDGHLQLCLSCLSAPQTIYCGSPRSMSDSKALRFAPFSHAVHDVVMWEMLVCRVAVRQKQMEITATVYAYRAHIRAAVIETKMSGGHWWRWRWIASVWWGDTGKLTTIWQFVVWNFYLQQIQDENSIKMWYFCFVLCKNYIDSKTLSPFTASFLPESKKNHQLVLVCGVGTVSWGLRSTFWSATTQSQYGDASNCENGILWFRRYRYSVYTILFKYAISPFRMRFDKFRCLFYVGVGFRLSYGIGAIIEIK